MGFPRRQYDVVLVHPPAEVVREKHDRPDYPAIGLAYLGNYLEQHTELTTAIIDARLGRLDFKRTVSGILALEPTVVGLTAMTHMITTAGRIAEAIKQARPDMTVVLGGFHASFLPERTLNEFPAVDIVVVGEGEIAFAELATRLVEGRGWSGLPGVWYRDGGQVVDSGRGMIPATLDELGEPAWHLFDQETFAKYTKFLGVMSQRGCPFACNFCSRPYGRTMRKRTPKLTVDELQRNHQRYGIKGFWFYDETFSVDKDHVYAICEEIVGRGLNRDIKWGSMVHANTIDNKLIRAMLDAGNFHLSFGVESGNEDIISQMGKGVTKERIIRAAEILRAEGAYFGAYFILGHPNETLRSIWDTIRFLVKLNPSESALGIMVPYPGTEIWEMANRGEGGYRKLSADWDDYNKQVGNAVELEHLSRRMLELAQIVAYVSLFLFNLRIADLGRSIGQHYKLAFSILRKAIVGHR